MHAYLFILMGVVLLVMAFQGHRTGEIYVGSKKAMDTNKASREEPPNMFFATLLLYAIGGLGLIIWGLASL